MGASPSPSKTGILSEIETPEKQMPPLRRSANKNVAFSVKDVRKVAQRLHKQDKDGFEQANRIRYGELSSMEDFASCTKDSRQIFKAKPPIKLPDSIQILTGRRFTLKHLAQMKFIFPESIEIQKIVVHDEASCCLKPELQVFMRHEAEEKKNSKGESGYTSMRRMFREKLLDFSEEHLEEYDLPESVLPYPFDQTMSSICSSSTQPSHDSTSLNSTSGSLQSRHPSISSHMPQSFKKCFSQKNPTNVERTSLKCQLPESTVTTPIKCISRASGREKSRLGPLVPSPMSTNSKNINENVKDVYGSEGLKAVIDSSPSKLNLDPPKLMTETPELQTEKRYRPSSVFDTPPDHDIQPARKKTKRCVRAKLSLTPEKNPKEEARGIENVCASSDDDLSFLPNNLLRLIKEKESKALAMKEAGVQEFLKRQRIVSHLPETFDLILLLFQSRKGSVMTKKELIHKIISGHLKIVDKSEVEEQLKMLQEIVPDWISMKTTMNGDSLFWVEKVCDPDEIRRKISEAKREAPPTKSS